MPRQCQITGAKVTTGNHIHRSGKAKKEGGIGRHVTKRVKRKIYPNIQDKRIWVPELNKFVKVRLTMRALKTINKNGAYKVLADAGVIKRPRIRRNKKAAAKPATAA
ncbi:MAG: 50S ribosomal protein L28 [Verrucomicrobiaceae bacterium]